MVGQSCFCSAESCCARSEDGTERDTGQRCKYMVHMLYENVFVLTPTQGNLNINHAQKIAKN